MKKIEASKSIVDLEDNPVLMSPQDKTPLTVGKTVALIFQNYKGKRFDVLKCLELARSFYKKETVLLDKADLKILKEIIHEDQMFGPLVRGQILETLDEASEEKSEDDNK